VIQETVIPKLNEKREQAEMLLEVAKLAARTGLKRKEIFYTYLAIDLMKETNKARAISLSKQLLQA